MDFENFATIRQIASSFCAALAAMFLKQVKGLDLNQTLYLRALSGFIIFFYAVNRYKFQVFGFDNHTVKILIERGILASFGAFIFFKGLDLVLLSESFILNRMSPIWTSIIQIVILKKEKLNFRLFLNMLLCSLGIYLVAKNKKSNKEINDVEDEYYHSIGIILILMASINQAIVNILIKQVNKEVNSIVISFYQTFFAIIFPLFNSITQGSNFIIPSQNDAFIIIIMSVLSVLAGVLQVQAMKFGKLSVISNVSQIQIFFGYLIDLFIFQVEFNIEQILGNILLLFSLIPLLWK